jgi:hypothetical protein
MPPDAPGSQQKRDWLLPAAAILILISLVLVPFGFGVFAFGSVLREISKGENINNGLFAGRGGAGSVDCSGVTNIKAEYLPWIKDAAAKWLGGDEAALIALIQIESAWNPKAVPRSKDGGLLSSAKGFGQFLTGTANERPEFKGGNDGTGRFWSAGTISDGDDPDDARYDPERSIYATAHYLGELMKLPSNHHDIGLTYYNNYHGGHNEEGRKGRERLEKVYAELKSGGGCKENTPATSDSTGGGSTAGPQGGKILTPHVPAVSQATSGDCGQASVLMVARFYNSSFRNADFYNPVTNETKDNGGCVSPNFLSDNTPYKDWVRYAGKSWEPAKRSIAGGDPVVLYTAPGAIYHEHIVVIAGYDPADKTFYINNPSLHKCECAPPTKTPGGKKATEEWLSKYWGTNWHLYHTNYMVRKKYL